jgi:hypothetical protein
MHFSGTGMLKNSKNQYTNSKHWDNPESRRYLINIDSLSTHQLFTDCLIVGSGIAGLCAALQAASNCNVMLVCKKK